MLSPCITPGTVTQSAYNHYSLLRSVEDNFALAPLGYAGQGGLQPFGSDIFTNPACEQLGSLPPGQLPGGGTTLGAPPQFPAAKVCRVRQRATGNGKRGHRRGCGHRKHKHPQHG